MKNDRSLEIALFILLIYLTVISILSAAYFWQSLTQDSFHKSIYWAVQTMTTVGYGAGFSNWGDNEFMLCTIWMALSVIIWACLITYIASWFQSFMSSWSDN